MDERIVTPIVGAADRALNAAQAAAEPDMRHPKIQALIGGKARREIELRLVEQLIDNPDCDLSSMDMEYWHGLHDKLRGALLKQAAPVVPAERAGWQGAAEWLRNNYQDHPTIAGLCDAMIAAAPQPAPEPPNPSP